MMKYAKREPINCINVPVKSVCIFLCKGYKVTGACQSVAWSLNQVWSGGNLKISECTWGKEPYDEQIN